MIHEKRDARVIYKLLRDAAIANPNSVYTLIWMERVLQALIVASSDDNIEAAKPPEATTQSPSWVADPVLDVDRLRIIDQALSEEVRKRLAEGAVHMETVHSLSTTANCLLSGGFECVPLRDRLLDWHVIALEKLPEIDKRRAILELSLATLYAERGELDLALKSLERAISTSGGGPGYRLHKGFLLARLGRVDEAIRIADEVEREMDWRRGHARSLEVLRLEIQRVEGQRATGTSGADGDALVTH
jgi:tetratricopeptide (TPR) repeat protein